MQDKLYKAYVADSMWLYAHGKCIEKKYSEIIDIQDRVEKSGDEIAAEVIEKAGLILV